MLRSMTQQEFASFLDNGCTTSMVSNWESWKHKPSSKWIKIMEKRNVLSD